MKKEAILTDYIMCELWDKINSSYGRELFRCSHHDFARAIEQAVLQSDQAQSLRQDGFIDGVLLALQMMTADGDAGSHLHVELIKTAGLECVVRRAAQEGMVEAAGLNVKMPGNVSEAINSAMEKQI